jgi:hypothetical protein
VKTQAPMIPFSAIASPLVASIVKKSKTKPVAVQNDKVEADYTDGILTLTLPKVEKAVNKVVKVNLGGKEPAAIEGEADAQ